MTSLIVRRLMSTKKELTNAREQRRILAESDLDEFINLVHPKRCLGNVHREIITWWAASNASTHQLLLLPRDHMKSALVAYRVAWELTKDPTLRILYISSTSNLATKQLKFIKDILTCDNYRVHWPEMVNEDEMKREMWTQREIAVDDPRRAADSVRDPSIFTAGLTTNIVGMHCDIAVLDDVVVSSNAYQEDLREKVKEQYGYLSSIEGSNAREWVVGTRYHPLDLYATLLDMTVDTYDEEGYLSTKKQLFDFREWPVETVGDGTGEFIWPRQQGKEGKWYGFDREILAIKRGQYPNKIHYRAQYYNDPQDVDNSPIQRSQFIYYDANFLAQRDGRWYFKGEKLNVVAAVDFAYSTGKKSDYSCIAVVALDGRQNYYVMEIDRFKTDKISEYFNRILKLYEKWGFRKLRAEVTAGQAVLVKDIRENYIKPLGLSLIVEEYRPSRWLGAKEERIMATLEPKYANGQIYHYVGGNCQALEEELIFANPSHDDCKDALAAAVDFAIPPTNYFAQKKEFESPHEYHGKFGGVI